MQICFDPSVFKSYPNGLIGVLSNLAWANGYDPQHFEEIEQICCRTPSVAYKYVRSVNKQKGISPESERVFLKNPRIGIRYLSVVKRPYFLDADTQKRFWKKIVKNPEFASQWARIFGKRLSEEEEMVFAKDMRYMKEYSLYVIHGKFPEPVHQAILLRSFEDMSSYEKSCVKDYIKYVENK